MTFLSSRTAASFLATPPVKVNSLVTPPEREMIEIARKMMARCNPAKISSRFSPSESRSRSSAPANTVHGVDARRLIRLHGHGTQFVQTHVHLVGDIAKIPPAPRCTTVVHLKVCNDPMLIDLNPLGVLTADVEHGTRLRIHQVGTEAVAQNLRADMLLGERQRHPAIAGADEVGFLQIDREGGLDHLLDVGRRRFNRIVRFQHASERPPEFIAQLACRRPVLHLDNRLVVDVEQQIVGKVCVARDLFGMSMVARSRDVPEEVGFAFGARSIKFGRLLAQSPEHLTERILHTGRDLGEALTLDLADAGLLQIVELFEKLLETKGSLERAEERVEVDQPMGGGERPPEQRELPVDARLL